MEIASKTGQVSYLQKGEQGKPGVMLYPAGKYSSTQSYTRTALTAPMVLYPPNYYALNKEGTFSGINPKDDYAANGSGATWVLVEKVQYAFMEVLMANFAKLASAVFHGQYMFSQQGIDPSGSDLTAEGAYRDFNASDPMAATNAFRPNLLMDFLTGDLYGHRLHAEGGEIGGFEIGGNYIQSDGGDNHYGHTGGKFFLHSSGNGFLGYSAQNIWSGIGLNTQPAGSAPSLARFSDTRPADSYLSLGTKTAITIDVAGEPTYDNDAWQGNHAIAIPRGDVIGLRRRLRRVSTSQTLSKWDNIVVCVCTKTITLTLPAGCENGQEVWMTSANKVPVDIAPSSGDKISGLGYGFSTDRWHIYIYDALNHLWIYGCTSN